VIATFACGRTATQILTLGRNANTLGQGFLDRSREFTANEVAVFEKTDQTMIVKSHGFRDSKHIKALFDSDRFITVDCHKCSSPRKKLLTLI
jgi:hypothetical protein